MINVSIIMMLLFIVIFILISIFTKKETRNKVFKIILFTFLPVVGIIILISLIMHFSETPKKTTANYDFTRVKINDITYLNTGLYVQRVDTDYLNRNVDNSKEYKASSGKNTKSFYAYSHSNGITGFVDTNYRFYTTYDVLESIKENYKYTIDTYGYDYSTEKYCITASYNTKKLDSERELADFLKGSSGSYSITLRSRVSAYAVVSLDTGYDDFYNDDLNIIYVAGNFYITYETPETVNEQKCVHGYNLGAYPIFENDVMHYVAIEND